MDWDTLERKVSNEGAPRPPGLLSQWQPQACGGGGVVQQRSMRCLRRKGWRVGQGTYNHPRISSLYDGAPDWHGCHDKDQLGGGAMCT